MGQLYQPLSIGTAKPELENLSFKTHLFDHLEMTHNFSSADFRREVMHLLPEIWARGKLPVIVGGSLFYLFSLFFPPKESADGCTHISDEYLATLATRVTSELWGMLREIDPERAAQINPNDRYRLERALKLWHVSGKRPSECAPVFAPPAQFMFWFLHRDPQELRNRIDQRVDLMMQQGFLQEVAGLAPEWRDFIMQKRLIGYPELYAVLDGTLSLDDAIAQIKLRTWHYARRQLIFWRRFKAQLAACEAASWGSWCDVDLTLHPVTLYLEQMVTEVQRHNKK